jgi:ribosome-binding factor A
MNAIKSENSAINNSRIQCVDGTALKIGGPSQSLRRKKDQQSNPKVLQSVARLNHQIIEVTLGLLSTIRDPFLRQPIWRLSKAQHSSDHQHVLIFWQLTSATNSDSLRQKLLAAFNRAAPAVRHSLARSLFNRGAPSVNFKFDCYGPQTELDHAESHAKLAEPNSYMNDIYK